MSEQRKFPKTLGPRAPRKPKHQDAHPTTPEDWEEYEEDYEQYLGEVDRWIDDKKLRDDD